MPLGVNGTEKDRVGGFKSEEVPVCSRIAPESKIGLGFLAEAEGHGKRSFAFDPANDVADPVGSKLVVFAGLHDHCAVSESDGLARASQDFIAIHAVTREILVGTPESAIHALPAAVAGDLDQSAEMNSITHGLFANRVGKREKFLQHRGAVFPEPLQDVGFGQ